MDSVCGWFSYCDPGPSPGLLIDALAVRPDPVMQTRSLRRGGRCLPGVSAMCIHFRDWLPPKIEAVTRGRTKLAQCGNFSRQSLSIQQESHTINSLRSWLTART